MDFENHRRFSQSIADAAEIANKDEARKAAALVVNSFGQMVTPKRTERSTAFWERYQLSRRCYRSGSSSKAG